jgi:hypothetical protein
VDLHRADGSVFEICAEDENASDISTFVDGQLAEFCARTPCTLPALITERASGVFVWVRLVVERILDLELEGSGLGKMEAAVRSTFRHLDDLYRQLIQDMEPASLKLVEWICFAEQPLSIDDLRWAMVIEADHPYKHQSLQEYQSSEEYVSDPVKIKRRVQILSRGLAEVTPSGRPVVQFIHQSVKDFFMDEGLLALGGYATSADAAINAHLRLSKICTRYLSMYNICSETSDPTYQFLRYARIFWMKHAEQCDENAQKDLLALMNSHTVHGPATDSGYASASLCQKSVANVHDADLNSSTLVATETCDAGTVYSGEGSISGDPELDAYQSELVDDLVNKMREFETEPETLASIFEQLPLRLKCFALRLGQPGSSKAERDVMYFVHKYRR